METLDKFSKSITIISALIASMAAYNSYQTNSKLNDIALVKEHFKSSKDSIDFVRDREFKFRIYQLVSDAISQKQDTLKQRAASIIVTELVSKEDINFKLGLLNVIKNASNNQEIKKEAGEAIFNVEESVKKIELSENEPKKRVDLFYLENSPTSAKIKAQELATHLGGQYEVRVRQLPTSINQNAGYRIASNQIRFEATESDEAQKIEGIIKSTNSNIQISKKNTINSTPNYISVFLTK